MMRPALLAAAVATALMLPRVSTAQRPLNLGFEQPATGDSTVPWGWVRAGAPAGMRVALDSSQVHSGRRSLRFTHAAPATPGDARGVATVRLFVPPLAARGRSVTAAAWVRTENAGGARFAIAAWTYGAVLAADSGTTWQSGTTSWTRVSRTIRVDSSAHAVVLDVQSRAAGSAWFDDLEFAVDGQRVDAVPVAPTPTAADRAWLEHHAWTLRTAEADGGDLRDLDAFRRIVGDARVIALGEDTHGTSEFFRMKHRLTRYLVEEMGARVFAIEANQLAVEPINRYVREGVGEVTNVMRGMFAVWNTEEMRAMIEWMRAHNVAHPDRKVSFVGYDMQDPSLPVDSIRAFLGRREPGLLPHAGRLYESHREAWRARAYPQAPDSIRTRWLANADSMWHLLSSRSSDWYAAATSAEDSASVEWALQNANVVRQAALAALSGRLGDRDSAMAVNIEWILSRHGSGRVVVWAHNGHVARDPDPRLGIFGGMSMGAYLGTRMGNSLRVFGLVSYGGRYRATRTATDRRFMDAPAVPAPLGAIEEVLHGIASRRGAGHLVVDLRPAREDPAGRWLLVPRPTRMIGYAAVDYDWEQMVLLPRVFDALVFSDQASPSRAVGRPGS